MWRSVGFFMSFSVIIELATMVAFIVIILSGKKTRDYGWKIVCSLLAVSVLTQCVSMSIVVSPTHPSRTIIAELTVDLPGVLVR
jgi:hypothetical protein